MTKNNEKTMNVGREEERDNFEKQYQDKEMKLQTALEKGDYEQAWNHCKDLFDKKISAPGAPDRYKAKAAYTFCKIMQQIPSNHEFLDYLIQTDVDLIRKSRTKKVSKEYARKYIGRKYLYYAADSCEYYPAMIEYALNCVGKGPQKSFVFEYNDRDAQVGLHWADRLMYSDDVVNKSMGYIVYAIYHFGKYTNEGRDFGEAIVFCDNVIQAWQLTEEKNMYSLYFLAHINIDPNFKDYQGGDYYNPKKGYERMKRYLSLAKQNLEQADPDLINMAEKIIHTLETKYPSKIE